MRKKEAAFLIIVSVFFILWSAEFIYQTSSIAIDGERYFTLFDDAMISMRYAWNFAHGNGLVWNAGEYVQGYTNLLMTLIMSLAALFLGKSDAVLAMQIFGIFTMLGIAYTNLKIADFFTKTPSALFGFLAFAGVLTYYPLAYWTLGGMETGLLTLLLLLGILSALKYTKSQNHKALQAAAFFLGLAFLTRNESLLFAALVWGYLFWENWQKKQNNNPLFSAIGLYTIFIIAQFTFQYLYYGEFLPNTYTLKLTGMSLTNRIENGIGFITPFIEETYPTLLLAFIGVFWRVNREKLLLLSLAVTAIGYQIYIGGDPWNYWRIIAPTMPLLIILLIVACTKLLRGIQAKVGIIRKEIIANLLLIALVLAGFAFPNIRFRREISFLKRPQYTDKNEQNLNAALLIKKLTTEDATIAVIWAGTIPYYSGRYAIDALGKCDRYIANLPPDTSGAVSWLGMTSVPGHNKYDFAYTYQTLKPTYIQKLVWGRQDFTEWAKEKYLTIEYEGVTIHLLADSPALINEEIIKLDQ